MRMIIIIIIIMLMLNKTNDGKSSPEPPKIDTAFPRCTATDNLCKRNEAARSSPDCRLALQPSSFRNTKDFGPIAPNVSMATGVKECVTGRPLYSATFISSASAATSPAARVAWLE